MIKPRLYACSGITIPDEDPLRLGRELIALDALGHDPNVHIRLEDIAKIFLRHLSDRMVDFLEIAAYVFAADSATSRGTAWTNGHATEAWARDFCFVVPVRDIDFWSKDEVKTYFPLPLAQG